MVEIDRSVGVQSGEYFKPEKYLSSLVILVETKKWEADRPRGTEYDPADTATADLSVFEDLSDLEAGKPTEELRAALINQRFLAADLKDSVGKGAIVVLQQRPNGPGRKPSWVWRAAPADVDQLVIEYINKREKELEEALGGDDTPEWLK